MARGDELTEAVANALARLDCLGEAGRKRMARLGGAAGDTKRVEVETECLQAVAVIAQATATVGDSPEAVGSVLNAYLSRCGGAFREELLARLPTYRDALRRLEDQGDDYAVGRTYAELCGVIDGEAIAFGRDVFERTCAGVRDAVQTARSYGPGNGDASA